jgi:hypothetical protein
MGRYRPWVTEVWRMYAWGCEVLLVGVWDLEGDPDMMRSAARTAKRMMIRAEEAGVVQSVERSKKA